MRAGLEAPREIRRQLLQIIKGRRIGWQQQGLPWRTGETRVAPNAESNLIGVREAVANVPSVRANQIRVVDALSVCMEIRAGCGIIEASERAAKLCPTAYGGKASTLREEGHFGNPRRSAMCENLNDARDCVCSVQRTFGAMHDLDFIHVVEREVGKVHVAAREINRCSVDKHFRKAGISTIEKNGGQTADRTGAGDGNPRLCRQQIRQKHRLALIDFLAPYEIDGSGSLAHFERLRIGSDDDV